MSYFVYGISFFVFTLLIQYALHKLRKNKNIKNSVWTGYMPIIIIAAIGIINRDLLYLGAVVGYAAANHIGKELNWH